MNTSNFMDKQIMDLSESSSSSPNDVFFIDLLNSQEEKHNKETGVKNENILPSYDFQPIRPLTTSQSLNHQGITQPGTRVSNSVDTKINSSVRSSRSMDVNESAKITSPVKDCKDFDARALSEIDRAVKRHADDLLHAIEGVSARLTQMESRTRNLESLVLDMKVFVENNHGITEGKLRQMENMLREVQTGVQFLQDKQEIAEAHELLAKLQASKRDQESESRTSSTHSDSQPQSGFSSQQSHQPLLPPAVPPQPVSSLSPPNAPPPQPQQGPPSMHLSPQLPANPAPPVSQREHYFPPPVQLPEVAQQPYQLSASHLSQPPQSTQVAHQAALTHQSAQPPQLSAQPPPLSAQPPPLSAQPPPQHQLFQPVSQPPHYSQTSQIPQHHQPTGPVIPHPHQQHQPSISHRSEENSYVPARSNPPTSLQSPSINQAPSVNPPSQQFYGSAAYMYDPPAGLSSGYGRAGGMNVNDSYSYSGSPSRYGSSATKPPQLSSSPSDQSGGGSSSYARLPTARLLPQSLPTASSVSSGSSSSESGKRVPIDDVVDKVVSMGFSRDQVRTTVRRLTENGQSVDLNVVLDKLMNG